MMKVTMTPIDEGAVQVLLERDGRVYSFEGRITSSDLAQDYNFEMDYEPFSTLGQRISSRPSFHYTLELDVRAVQMVDLPRLDARVKELAAEDLSAKLASYPQRHVLGMDAPEPGETEVVFDHPEPNEPIDIPKGWIDLDGA
jgi:hypothetical protein